MKIVLKFSESSKFSFLSFFFIFIFPFSFFSSVFSQPGTWAAVYGGTNYDRGRSICQTYDKGYIVCGPTSSYGAGNTDFYLLKIDSAGKYQWQNTFGGINIEDCHSVQQTRDSGFIICGFTNSFGAGGYDAYLVKTDSLGHLQWQKTYGGSDWDFAYWAEQTNDGGYILCGETYSYGSNDLAYVVRTNSIGDTLWTKTFGTTGGNILKEIHQTSDSGFIAAGFLQASAGDSDVYLLKINSNGDTLWTKTFGNNLSNICNSVTVCSDKGFVLGGFSYVAGYKKNYFIKTDSAGNLQNAVADTLGNKNHEIYRIRQNKEGDYYTVGWTDGAGFGMKEMVFAKWNSGFWYLTGGSAGGTEDDIGYDILQNSDSGYTAVGYTASYGMGPDNIFIIRTDKSMGYNNTINTYVSVNEISQDYKSVLIYPNPFSKNLFLKTDQNFFANAPKFSFSISDLYGREIFETEKNISSNEPVRIEIPEEKFTNGFYFIAIRTEDKSVYRKLLFIR